MSTAVESHPFQNVISADNGGKNNSITGKTKLDLLVLGHTISPKLMQPM